VQRICHSHQPLNGLLVMRLTVVGECLKLRTREFVALSAVLQVPLIDATFQKRAIRGPMQRTIAPASGADHAAFDHVGDALVLLQPPHLAEPGDYDLCSFWV
jgi:hypothetical protein